MEILWFRRRPPNDLGYPRAIDLIDHAISTTDLQLLFYYQTLICNSFSVTYTVMQLLKYTFLSILTFSPLTTAFPAPAPPHALLHSTTEPQPAYRPVKCADATPSSHLYCQNRGCEFCLEVGSEPDIYFVCDGYPASWAASASNGGNISTTDVWEIDY